MGGGMEMKQRFDGLIQTKNEKLFRLEKFQYLFQSQYFQSLFTLKIPFLKILISQSHGGGVGEG